MTVLPVRRGRGATEHVDRSRMEKRNLGSSRGEQKGSTLFIWYPLVVRFAAMCTSKQRPNR